MGQDETDGSEDRVENNTSLTPVPSVGGSTQSSPDSLLLLDVAFGPPGVNFPGGTEILGC